MTSAQITDPHGVLRAAQAITERPLQPDEVIEVVDALERLNADEQAYWFECLKPWATKQDDVVFWAWDWMELWLTEKYDVDEKTYYNHPLFDHFSQCVEPALTLAKDLGADDPSDYTFMPHRYDLMGILPDSWQMQNGTYVGPWGQFSLSFQPNDWGGFDVIALVRFNETELVKKFTVDDLMYVVLMREEDE